MKYFSCYDEFSEILLSKYTGFHVAYQLLYPYFNEILNLSTDFRRILQYKIS